MKKGLITAIEGTDGSGKETQMKLLRERFEKEGLPYKSVSFPRYDTPTGRIIGQCYLGKKDLGQKYNWQGDYNWFGKASNVKADVISLFYAADRKDAMEEIEESLKMGTNWFFDRWVESNMGHQPSKIEDNKKRLEMIKYIEALEYGVLKLSKPDILFFLNLPVEYSIKAIKERGELMDGHESDIEYLKRSEQNYLELCKMYDWTKIDCINSLGERKSREELHKEMWEIVSKKLL